ncbi:hypothetical protein Taro_004411 [Colocasia esculenta]|uniref:Protein kinase domain-containing protein n=1 Tax=Colocasia esculenta TaxID=4460 RepID=A0A843TPH1_COLES|nr:hypothetical protein [Colocasia esculenta]
MKWRFRAPQQPICSLFTSSTFPAVVPAMGGDRGKWVRGRCLGRGSTATVYLAASASGKPEAFAVKSAELSRSAPLQREQKVLSSLCSPHVVACFGSDVRAEPDGRVLYNLFMEYVPGGSLAEAIKRQGGLEERAIRSYTRGILDGLAYVHGRGLVHCDVKGHNILVREDGVGAKLADFGCARWVDGGKGRAVISGTPLYMAPEVARGEEQGPAADIWALGCTVIEMATGFPPWRDVEDPVAAIHRIAFSADVPEFPCGISDDARDFLGRCLNRDPTKRWSAEELLSHSFVNNIKEFTTDGVSECKGNSPKSTLDQGFWDSWQDEEEDEEKRQMDNQPAEPAQERLRQLLGGGISPPPAESSTWEESCWVTIRDSDGGESPDGEEEPSTSGLWLVGAGFDAVGGTEQSAAYPDPAIATAGGYLLPSNPFPHSFMAHVNTDHSSSVDERINGLVETHSFHNYFIKHGTFPKDCEYHTCNDLGDLLQEIMSNIFVIFKIDSGLLL